MRKVKKGLFGSQYVEFDDRRPQLEGWALVKWVDQQKRSLDNPTDYEDSWHELWLSSSYALIRAHVWRGTQFRQGSGRPTETYGAITNTATDSDLEGHAPTLGTSDVARLVTRELDQNRSGFSRRISLSETTGPGQSRHTRQSSTLRCTPGADMRATADRRSIRWDLKKQRTRLRPGKWCT